MGKTVLIGCEILREEFEFLLREKGAASEVEVVWLDAGLHSDPLRLERELTSAIGKVKSRGEDAVRLLFGAGCLPEMDFSMDGERIPMAAAKNCLSILVGNDKAKELERGGAMLMTPSWVRTWPENTKRMCGWSEVDFRMNLGRYEKILVLDPGINPLTEEETLEFFDLVQVPVEFEPISMDCFRGVLGGLLK
ncbi:MAG: DUF1638 domain-containing protein [Syntrophobacteraceae bacterium]